MQLTRRALSKGSGVVASTPPCGTFNGPQRRNLSWEEDDPGAEAVVALWWVQVESTVVCSCTTFRPCWDFRGVETHGCLSERGLRPPPSRQQVVFRVEFLGVRDWNCLSCPGSRGCVVVRMGGLEALQEVDVCVIRS